MKIVIVDLFFTASPYDRELCIALSSMHHDVFIVATSARQSEPWDIENVTHVPIEIIDLFAPLKVRGPLAKFVTIGRHARYAWDILALVKIVKRLAPDVVHFQWCFSPIVDFLVLSLLPRSVRTAFTVHNVVPFNGDRVSALSTVGLIRLKHRFDRLITHTSSARDTLIARGLQADRISIVPHGALRSSAETAGRIFRKVSHSQTLCFLLFGSMRPYKGIDVLIEAASKLSEAAKARCRFLIAGKAEMGLAPLIELCNARDVRHLFEFDARHVPDEDIPRLFERADVCVFPYRTVDASGVFTLAIQFGHPLIVSDLGMFKDHVVDGIHGFVVKAEDSSALACAIEKMTEDDDTRNEMARSAALLSNTLLSWSEVALLTTQAYRETGADHVPPRAGGFIATSS